mgnify:CR=1 FL=1
MAILSKDDAKKILEKVIGFSKADGIEANLGGNDGGNIRYARNSVSTAGEDSSPGRTWCSSSSCRQGNFSLYW